MNVYDLYEAIGAAEERYLLHSERRVTRRGRRLAAIGITIGILLTAMATTVAASPTVRDWIFGVKKLQAVRMGEGLSIVAGDLRYEQNSFLSVIPEAELRDNPPQTLETFYVPGILAEEWSPGNPGTAEREYPELFLRVESIRKSKNLETCLVFEAPDSAAEQGNRSRVIFHQYAAPLLQSGEPLLLLELGPDSRYTAWDETVAGCGVCTVIIPAWSTELRSGLAQYWYFWSDGMYIYAVGFHFQPEQPLIEDVITGLQPVNSLRKFIQVKREDPPPAPLTRNLTPAWVPEGYALREDYEPYSFEDGYVSFFWFGPGEGTGRRGYFRLTLCTDPGEPEAQRLFWAAEAFPEVRDHTETECTVRGRPAVLYESKLAVELIWQEEDGVTVELHSEYEGRLSGAELLRIAESLQDAPILRYEEETP